MKPNQQVQKRANSVISNGQSHKTALLPLSRFNPDDYLVCQTSRCSEKEVQDFLAFCRKVFPSKTNKFGILFNSDIDVTKSLKLLHDCNYDFNLAKFRVAFPLMTRFSAEMNFTFDKTVNYEGLINDFIFKKSMNSNLKEKNYFDSLHSLVIVEKKQAFYKTIKGFVEEGLKNKFTIAPDLIREILKSQKAKKNIEKFIEEKRVLLKLEFEISFYKSFPIIPENYDALIFCRDLILEELAKVRDFMAPENFRVKDIQEMTGLINGFFLLKIGSECSPEFAEFFTLYEKTVELHSKINLIIKPTILKEPFLKISFSKAYKLLEELSTSHIKEDQKVSCLIQVLCRKELCFEMCMMFCEDERTTDSRPFFLFNDDLRKGALDCSAAVQRTELKIKTLEHLSFLHKFMDQESKLDENLRHSKELSKLNTPFNFEEIQKIKSYLEIHKKIELKALELDCANCSLSDFLFADNNLVEFDEFAQLLKEFNLLKNINHNFMIVENIEKISEKFENLILSLQDFKEINTSSLFQKVNIIFSLKLKNSFFENEIREELAGRIEIAFFIHKIFEKYSVDACKFKYPEFTAILETRTKMYPTFEENSERVLAEIEKLKDESIKSQFRSLIDRRKYLNDFISHNFNNTDFTSCFWSFEKQVKRSFKDKELFNKVKVKIRFRQSEYNIRQLELCLNIKYERLDDLEYTLIMFEGDNSVLENKYELVLSPSYAQYHLDLKEPVKFNENNLDRLFQLIAKKKHYNDLYFEEIVQRLKICKDKITAVEGKFNKIFGWLEKKGPNYVFKTLRLLIISSYFHRIGVVPQFVIIIDTFLAHFWETEQKLKLGEKKTLFDLKTFVTKFEELHLYSHNYNQLLTLFNLTESFVNKITAIEFEWRGNNSPSYEILQNIQQKVQFSEFEFDWFEGNLEMTKRSFDLLENDTFANFLNIKGKRIKKYQNFNQLDPIKITEEDWSLKMRKVYPVKINDPWHPMCACRESYESSEMIQYNLCKEWFHAECLKISNISGNKIKENYCFACDFLAGKKNVKSEEFLKRKMKKFVFEEFVNCAVLIDDFVNDVAIDFIFYIIRKIKSLKEIIKEILSLKESGKEKETILESVHVGTLLCLYIPVEMKEVENFLKETYKNLKTK